jgi:flagellar protein FlhE
MNTVSRATIGLGLALAGMQAVAAGSWAADVPPLRVVPADHASVSGPIGPVGEPPEDALIGQIKWRYRHAPDADPAIRLCHPRRCIALPAMRGRTDGLRGLGADIPLRLYGQVPPAAAAVRIEAIQVIVDYR